MGHGRPIRQENAKDMNDLVAMMRIMMARMDAIEATQRRGIQQ